MPENQEPMVWASLGATIQTRPYENIKIDLGVSGIPLGASDELIDTIMKGATLSLRRVVDALAVEMERRIRDDQLKQESN